MKLAQEIQVGWQVYRRVGLSDYWTLSERYCELVDFEAPCAECGTVFRAKATKTAWHRRQVSRRCSTCRMPGIPVEDKPPKVCAVERLPNWALYGLAKWKAKRRSKKTAPRKRAPAPVATPSYLE